MNILAIDPSSAQGSVALLSADAVIEDTWPSGRGANQRLFALLPDLLARAGCSLTSVDRFAVGLGPGSFSGLRTALAAAQGFAMPRTQPVTGINSALAIATDLARDEHTGPITVVGDARRNRLWFLTFQRNGTGCQPADDPPLIPESELAEALPQGALLATPDWDRIGERLTALRPDHVTLADGPQLPRAQTIARLARDGTTQPLPLEPIYLHPPVARPEVRDQRSEVRGQKSEVGGA